MLISISIATIHIAQNVAYLVCLDALLVWRGVELRVGTLKNVLSLKMLLQQSH